MEGIKVRLRRYRPVNAKDKTLPVLDAFLTYLPEDGKNNLIQDLESLQSNQEIRAQADSLLALLLYPMVSLSASELNVSQPYNINGLVDILKSECLERDYKRCTITKMADYEAMRDISNEPHIGITECAPIIPFLLAPGGNSDNELSKEAVWDNLIRYFPAIEQEISFTRDDLKSTENAITMEYGLRWDFLKFWFALQPTQHTNLYRVKTYDENVAIEIVPNQTVFFTSQDAQYPLPSHVLLETQYYRRNTQRLWPCQVDFQNTYKYRTHFYPDN
ncbi:hypothetical protein N7456_010308 [Penicillium angulare]|uniref:HNH nuclease domain-containing protein n=1 Tax=Penicillium angulare TaxID=116970 RepID=A0A9W9F6I7_9EURO|nr:hypothetical protein N7456_010308 [Penicillium angulare]